MRLQRNIAILPLAGAILLAACGDVQPTAPLDDDVLPPENNAVVEDAMVLDVLSFQDGIDAALALTEGPVSAAGRHGWGARMRVRADDDATQARLRFENAVRVLQQGDTAGALVQAREARRLVVRAGQATMGNGFAAALRERVEAHQGWVSENPGGYNDPAGLQGELNRIAERVRERIQARDSVGAGEWCVLAEQRVRQRQRQGENRIGAGGAELSVALGASAVALATEVLSGQEPDTAQLRYLAAATAYQEAAEAALEAGDLGRANQLSDLAEWTALKAIVLPGGVTMEEAEAMATLAQELYADAAEGDLTDLQAVLLRRAADMIAHGLAALEANSVRGVVPLWRAAVICAWILG